MQFSFARTVETRSGKNAKEAMQLSAEPIGPLPANADPVELAAWTTVCNVVLNLDEFLMKHNRMNTHWNKQSIVHQTRRYFLGATSGGLGALALQNLLGPSAQGASTGNDANPLAPRVPPMAAKAKRVIYLHMTGSPPNLDLFDYKPKLVEMDGQDAPNSVLAGKEFAFTTGSQAVGNAAQIYTFGQLWDVALRLPSHLQTVADELCVVHSMHTDQFNHGAGKVDGVHGFASQRGRPSFGSWVTYGLEAKTKTSPRMSSSSAAVFSQRWQEFVRKRFSAECVPGSAVPLAGGSCIDCFRSAGDESRPAAKNSRYAPRVEWFQVDQLGTPKRKRGSHSTSWRFECKPVCPR